MKISLSLEILSALAPSPAQTMISMQDYCRIGPADTLFGPARAEEEGRTRSVGLVAVRPGFVCTTG